MQLVTNLNNAGAGSLRAAIAAATVGEEIQFSVTGIITLGAGYVIPHGMIITGPGSSLLIINGAGNYRIFETQAGIISISGITITDGASVEGAGIYNTSTLTLSDVLIQECVSDNDGAGIWNSSTINCTDLVLNDCIANGGNGGGIWSSGTITGTIDVIACTCSGAGGGIFNTGTLTQTGGSVVRCLASGFGTNGGGGVYSNGTYTLTEVTIDGNTTSVGSGDGIFNTFGTVEVTRCTVSANTTTGIFNDTGSVNIENSTISSNGATGVYNASGAVDIQHSTIVLNVYGLINDAGSEAAFYNTILAGNTTNDYDGDTADSTSNGHNIFGVNTNPITPAAGDLTVLTFVALVMGPLQNNLGPTETHALLAGSPAIDAGENSGAPPTDQRGQPRINGTFIDIGAYESLPSGDCLVFTGELPSWITQEGNCLTGAAGIFTAATKAEANALAQAALDAFVAAQEEAETLNCGTPAVCSNRDTQTITGELTIASDQSTLRGPGAFYSYNFPISVEINKGISVYAASDVFDTYIYITDAPNGGTVLAFGDSGGYNAPGSFYDNTVVGYTPTSTTTVYVQVTSFSAAEVGAFTAMITDGIENTITQMDAPWVAIYVESTNRVFAIGPFDNTDTPTAYIINCDTDVMTSNVLSVIGNSTALLFYNPNDDSVWAGISPNGIGGAGTKIYRLDPTSGATIESFNIGPGCLYFPAFVPGINKLLGGKHAGANDDKIAVYNCSTRAYELPSITVVNTDTRAYGKYLPDIDRVAMQSQGFAGWQIINPNDKTVGPVVPLNAYLNYGFYHNSVYYAYGGGLLMAFDIQTGVVSHQITLNTSVLLIAYNPCRDCLMAVTYSNDAYSITALRLDDFSFIDCTFIAKKFGLETWMTLVANTTSNRMYFVFGPDEILIPPSPVGAAYRIA